MTDDEKKVLDKLVTETGNRIAAVIDQMLKGNWVDDMGHNVVDNVAMLDMRYALRDLGIYRAQHLGYAPFDLSDAKTPE